MEKKARKIRLKAFEGICATCKHLKVLETSREFEKIIDTEYTLFSCAILGWKKKEFYLMAPVKEELGEQSSYRCPFWEEWTP